MIESGARLLVSPAARRNDLIRRLALAAMGCVALVVLIEVVFTSSVHQTARNAAADDLNALRTRLQDVLNADVQLLRGMAGYVRSNPDISLSEFDLIAQDMLEGAADHVRNVALARDLVISHVYPFEGNRGVLGLNYRNTPEQWPAVQRVVETNQTVIAGPLELKQGGVGLIARFPIYLRPDANGQQALWGIASTVIDFQKLLDRAGVPEFEEIYRMALVGRNGNPSDPKVFWGESAIRSLDPIELNVAITNGEWKLLAVPRAGWQRWWWSAYTGVTIGLGALLFAVIAALIWVRYRGALERDELYRQLVIFAQQAQAASSAKSNFVAVMSHELRTPLNAIIGFSQLLVQSETDSPLWKRARSYLADIERSGQFLLSIINDILDLSRIESGRFDLQPEAIDVVGELHRVARRLALSFEERGITLRLPEAGRSVIAYSDARAFQQVLINILSNAQKHNPSNTVVTVSVQAVPQNMVLIEVSDTGVGIPSDKLSTIWEPFVQVESSYTRTSGGSGLGLSICQGLVAAMHGAIEIDSASGVGTIVRIRIPGLPENLDLPSSPAA